MEQNQIKSLINMLGFTPKNNQHNMYCKIYSAFDYEIQIDFNTKQIIYTEPLRLGDKTTSNFSADENFVVLECVDRLLSQGYDPQYIELERNFPLGYKTKGKLDINVYNPDGTTFLMIECKTFGAEYNKAKKNTLKDVGQLLSYFQQDKSTKILCLYASTLDTDIKYIYDIIECTQSMGEASDTHSTFAIWNKQFKNNGLFEPHINPYNFKPKALRKIDLKPLEQGDSGIIFNGFMEILRHNVVSDKGNAFNKIFNLFLCKLNDEKRLDTEELDFQWKENDTYESLLMRLNEIYANSVKDHLNKDIVNLTQKQIEALFDGKNKNEIIQKIKEVILYKNNEFAFIDVFDEESFIENSIIVREVVELLQFYQIRYGKKQQFLGDFFEKLINTGFKQESGQFFTPVPLARFMINALPLQQITQEKLDNREPDFLPYIIDYAMGTGHFLTEAMDQMQKIINSDNLIAKTTDTQRKLKLYQSSDSDFDWAKEFIYGLERDYRLVKTAKIACFFHGDGLANIIHGDGLDNFYHSKTYTGLLKLKRNTKDNLQFDIVVANPPYSVSAFKNTLKSGEESFDLFDMLTDASGEIECLFIERTKQLLKTNGYASVILPSSILSNGKIHAKARHILLTFFEMYAICEFGANTFAATGTNTVVLFLKRRDDNVIFDIKQAVNLFFNTYRDVTVNHIEEPFSNYAKDVHNLTFDDYIQNLKTLDKQQEIDKLTLYILNYKTNTIIVKSGDKDIEKKFLGYEFSNRRGSEGIKIYVDDDNKPMNKLFNYDDLHDDTKVSAYVYQAGLNNFKKPIHSSLENHLTYSKLNALINFTGDKFSQEISMNVKKNSEVKHSEYLVLLGDESLFLIKSGGTPSTSERLYWNSKDISWATIDDLPLRDTVNIITETKKHISHLGLQKSSATLIKKHSVLISSRATIGTVAINEIELTTNQGFKNIEIVDKSRVHYKYLAYILQQLKPEIINLTPRGATYQEFSKSKLSEFTIPLPPLPIQTDMVAQIEAIDDEIMGLEGNFQAWFSNWQFDFSSFENIKLGKTWDNKNLCEFIQRGKSAKYGKSNYLIIKSGQARGFYTFDLSKPVYAIDSYTPDHRILRNKDVLINSTGVGTAGRVTIFKNELFKNNSNISYATDSHITICRPNPEILDGDYLMIALNKVYGNKEIENMAKGQSGQIELSLDIIKNLSIPLPPLSTQQIIVKEIEAQRKTIEDNKQKIDALNQKKQDIMNALWHKE